MPHTIREALIAMSYREVQPGHWMKPIGFQSLTYHEGKNEWSCWFRGGGDGNILLWETKSFIHDEGHDDYIYQLKHWECYTRTSMNPCHNSDFHLSSIDIKGL
jgi:hypothetical protein